MTTAAVRDMNRDELQELARGWGKIFAAEAFPQGVVGPNVDFNQIEELAGARGRCSAATAGMAATPGAARARAASC